MKKLPVKLIFGFLGLSTLASMVGAISGTVAWYAYVTRATVSYSGTSVNSTKQLQLGIRSDVAVEFPSGVVINDVPDGVGGHYYFMNPGANLPASVINAYLETKGYTTTTLEPVSSYTYATGEAIDLREAPTANKPLDARKVAPITKYVEIPFAFRVLESDLSVPTYVANKPIYITDADAVAASAEDGVINEAIRMYIDRNNGNDFIFNPNKDDDGKTKVAGILDITGDQVYDYTNDMSSPLYNKECLYGDYDLGTGISSIDELYSAPLAETSDFVDANESGITDRRTTFTAKHYQGINYLDLPTLEEEEKFVPHYAEYLGRDTVYPDVNDAGELENEYAVCVTSNDDKKIGEFTCKIYLEGWDFTVIDDELSHSFNLGLTFEIN